MYSAIVEHYAMNRLKSQDDRLLSSSHSSLFFVEVLFESNLHALLLSRKCQRHQAKAMPQLLPILDIHVGFGFLFVFTARSYCRFWKG